MPNPIRSMNTVKKMIACEGFFMTHRGAGQNSTAWPECNDDPRPAKPKAPRGGPGAHQFLAGGACRAATSPSAWSGRNGPPRTAVAPLYAARLIAARRVPPQADAAHCNKSRMRPTMAATAFSTITDAAILAKDA